MFRGVLFPFGILILFVLMKGRHLSVLFSKKNKKT